MTGSVLHLKSHILRMIGAKIDGALWSPISILHSNFLSTSESSLYFSSNCFTFTCAWAAAGMSLHFHLEWEDWIRMLYTLGLF